MYKFMNGVHKQVRCWFRKYM